MGRANGVYLHPALLDTLLVPVILQFHMFGAFVIHPALGPINTTCIVFHNGNSLLRMTEKLQKLLEPEKILQAEVESDVLRLRGGQ